MNEDKAVRYNRLKRTAGIVSLCVSAACSVVLLASGASGAMRDTAARAAAAVSPAALMPTVTVAVYVLLLLTLTEAVSLPVSFYGGYLLEQRYELSNESLGAWALDQIKSLALGAVLAGTAASILYALIRRSPDGWWLPAGLVFAVLIVGLAQVAPVLLLPLFYTVKPLARDALRSRLLALADRAGARVLGAYEWGLGEKSKKANAALAGIGGTRRILVSDTMLAEYSDDEIEVVLAHEIAHHVHGDIWKGILFESVLILAGFYLASRALGTLTGSFAIRGAADVAGLPLLLLCAGAVSIVMVPVAHALSRAFERRADRFALDLTRNPQAFISAMRRLGAQNLAEERPSKIVQWLFYSHPPIPERIAAARAFES